MVNFTCNTCGDSLKKKEVCTHFSRKFNCRQVPSLTCFDCLKIFGNDYVQHTMCVTEDQRYSANGLRGIEKNKTQVWTEFVHKHLYTITVENKTSLSPAVKNLIQFILNTSSIPKKEKTFFNFIKNVNRFQEKDVRTVWNMLSELAKQQESQPNSNGKPLNKNTSNKSNANCNETNQEDKLLKESLTGEEAAEEVTKSNREGKKKKKSKKAAELNEEVEDMNISEEPTETKKEKRKREKSESADALQSEETQMKVEEQEIQSEKLSKKEKKLKKKKEKFEAELKSVEAENPHEDQSDNMEDSVVEDRVSKTKKKRKQDVDIEVDKKKKKKKRERTVSMAAETDQPLKKNKSKGNDENTEPNEDAAEDVPPYRKDFNWADVIIQVLQSQDNNEISVKRLCKKVVNEYLSSLLDGAHVDELKATAKFQKKLHKTPGVFVHKDKAKLKPTE